MTKVSNDISLETKDDLLDLRSAFERTKRNLEAEKDLRQADLSIRDQKIYSLEEVLKQKQELLSSFKLQVDELNGQIEDLQIKLLQTQRMASEERDKEVIGKAVFEKISKQLELERELRRLKGKNETLKEIKSDNTVLVEKVRDLELRLQNQVRVDKQLADVEAELRLLKDQKTAPTNPKASSMQSLMSQFVETAKLEEEISKLRGELRAKTTALESASQRISSLEAQLTELQTKLR